MKKKILSGILGIVLICIVIWLGVQSVNDAKYVVLFGLASALVAPLGLSALGYSVKKEDPTLQKLALVSEIDQLIEKAETEAEKIERLKKEKEILINYIKYETKKIAKIERKKILETEAKRILEEYKKVNQELEEMSNDITEIREVSDEIKQLYRIDNVMQSDADEKVVSITVLGVDYFVRGLHDICSLPAEILVNLVDRLVIMLVETIQIFIDAIINRKK